MKGECILKIFRNLSRILVKSGEFEIKRSVMSAYLRFA